MSEDQRDQSGVKTYTGGCHCGAVRFEADLDLGAGVGRCNCTMCHMASPTGAIAKPSAFRLLSGEDNLTDYGRSGSKNRFPFCKTCGIRPFGRGDVPEVGGAYVSVNVNCLDEVDTVELAVHYWDGRNNNWDAGPGQKPWPIRPTPA